MLRGHRHAFLCDSLVTSLLAIKSASRLQPGNIDAQGPSCWLCSPGCTWVAGRARPGLSPKPGTPRGPRCFLPTFSSYFLSAPSLYSPPNPHFSNKILARFMQSPTSLKGPGWPNVLDQFFCCCFLLVCLFVCFGALVLFIEGRKTCQLNLCHICCKHFP